MYFPRYLPLNYTPLNYLIEAGVGPAPPGPEWQAKQTPFSILWSLRATGIIPQVRMQQLDPSGQRYYFQRTSPKSCLTRYTPRPDPNTPDQQVRRAIFTEAVQTWATLPPETQSLWQKHPEAKRKRIPGRNLYISHYLRGLI